MTSPCQCDLAGYCSRFRKQMNENLWRECQANPEYRQRWDERVADGFVGSPGGAGTELAKILEWFGYKKNGNCRCNEHMRNMNRNGTAWCRANLSTIVDWLQEEAREREVLFSRTAASIAIRTAIRRAERLGGV